MSRHCLPQIFGVRLVLSLGVYYAVFMSELEAAKMAQEQLAKAHGKYMHAVNDRDTAVKNARESGATAAELSTHLGLSRQQVHKILKGK